MFTKTIKERGPKGKNMIWSLVDHKADMAHTLGKPKELYIEGDMLVAVTDLIETECGEDAIIGCSGSNVDTKVRRSKVRWINRDNQELGWLYHEITNLFHIANHNVFGNKIPSCDDTTVCTIDFGNSAI